MGFWTDALGESAVRPRAYTGPFGLVGGMMLLASTSALFIARLGHPTGDFRTGAQVSRRLFEAVPFYAGLTLEAIGGRGVPYRFGSRTDREDAVPEDVVAALRARLLELFGDAADVQVERAWHGVLGVARTWMPAVGLDPATGRVVARIPVDRGASGVCVAGDSVWVTSFLAGTVSRIDAATNRVVARVHVGGSPHDVAAGAGGVWVTSDAV